MGLYRNIDSVGLILLSDASQTVTDLRNIPERVVDNETLWSVLQTYVDDVRECVTLWYLQITNFCIGRIASVLFLMLLHGVHGCVLGR